VRRAALTGAGLSWLRERARHGVARRQPRARRGRAVRASAGAFPAQICHIPRATC